MAGLNLTPIDFLSARIFCTDGTYLYGSRAGQSSYLLFRWAGRTSEPVQVFNFSTLTPQRFPIMMFALNGQLFAVLKDGAASKSAVYRSTTQGTTWDFCFLLGDRDGTTVNQVVNVELLPRGMIYHARTGKYVCGEYVYNPGTLVGTFVTYGGNTYECIQSHTSASSPTPDTDPTRWRLAVTLETPAAWSGAGVAYTAPTLASPVRIMSSADGLNWTQELIWNDPGAGLAYNTVRHCHGLAVDPYTEDIFIVCGDDAVHSGILRWDGTAALASNKRIAEFNPVTDGATGVGGHRKYRLVDVLFDADYIYGMADDPGTTSRGIWRIERSLQESTSYRMDDRVGNNAYHVGYVGLKVGESMLFTEFTESASATPNLQIWTTDDRVGWEPSGVYNCKLNTTGGTSGLFVLGDEIYLTLNGAGKSDLNTAVFRISGTWPVDSPQCIIHPVYWISDTGTDTTGSDQGWRPSKPWRTLQYALTGNRITNGARVILPAGTFTELGSLTAYSANTYPSSPTFPVVIEGAGKGLTHITGGVAAGYLLYFAEAQLPVVLKDAKFSCSANTGFPVVITAPNATAARKITVYQADVNDPVLSAGSANGVKSIGLGNNVSLDFVRSQSKMAVNSDFVTTGTSSQVTGRNSLTTGGKNIFYVDDASASLNWINCAAVGVGTAFCTTAVGATVVPVIKNCILKHANGVNGNLIVDSAGLAETDAQINNNLIYGNTVNIANNGGTNSIIDQDPLFVDEVGGNYRLRPDSPCINAGTIVAGIHDQPDYRDMAGRPLRGTPDIGPYEYWATRKRRRLGMRLGL